MSELAAQLVDRVIPRVPVRQWVLSLPFTLRYQLAVDAALTAAVLDAFIRSVFAGLRRAAAREGIADAQCGALTAIQRFWSALNANVHFHSLDRWSDAALRDLTAIQHALQPLLQRPYFIGAVFHLEQRAVVESAGARHPIGRRRADKGHAALLE